MNTYLVLLNKELRLQKNNLLFALVFFLFVIIAYFLKLTPLADLSNGSLRMSFVLETLIWFFGAYCGLSLIPIMIGSSATADEATLNTKEWQNSLPVSRNSIFTLKTFSVISITLLVTYVMLYTTFSFQNQVMKVSWMIIPTITVIVGLYCGTIVNTSIKSLIVSFLLLSYIWGASYLYTNPYRFYSTRYDRFGIPDFNQCILIFIFLIIYSFVNYKMEKPPRFLTLLQWLSIPLLLLFQSKPSVRIDFASFVNATQTVISKIYSEVISDNVYTNPKNSDRNNFKNPNFNLKGHQFSDDSTFPISIEYIKPDCLPLGHTFVTPSSYPSNSSRWQDIVAGSMANDVNRSLLILGYTKTYLSPAAYNGINLSSDTTTDTLPESYKKMFRLFGNQFYEIHANSNSLSHDSKSQGFYRIVTSQNYHNRNYYESGIISHDPYKNRGAFLRHEMDEGHDIVRVNFINFNTMESVSVGSLRLDHAEQKFILATWTKSGEFVLKSRSNLVKFTKPGM